MDYKGKKYRSTEWIVGKLLEEKHGDGRFIVDHVGNPIMVDAASVHPAPPAGLDELFDIEFRTNPEGDWKFDMQQYFQIMQWAVENLMGEGWSITEVFPVSIIDPQGRDVWRDGSGVIIDSETQEPYIYGT
jgi:hypothetical protein